VDEQGECEDPHPQETVLTTRPVQRDRMKMQSIRSTPAHFRPVRTAGGCGAVVAPTRLLHSAP
jgi:hypothetical protein